MKRKLSEEDKKILLDLGHLEKDLDQIEKALSKTIYKITDLKTGVTKNVKAEEARDVLGNEIFLSGISRSAFHYTSSRETKDDLMVLFDSHPLFKEFEKEAEEFENLKGTIQEFVTREYGEDEEADFSNLEKVDLAYTTTEDEKHEIQVSANLIDLELVTSVDGKVVETIKYKSLDEMEYDIRNITSDDLISIDIEESEGEEL